MTIIERILGEMEHQGKRAVDLARVLDVRTSVTSTWKKYNRNPPAEYLSRICEFLNVSAEWLLTGNGEKSPRPENAVSIWQLQDYQRKAMEQFYSNLTDDQVLLLDNYSKLTLRNRMEIQAIITLKITSQAEHKEGRADSQSGTA